MERSKGVPEFDCPGRSRETAMVRLVGGAEVVHGKWHRDGIHVLGRLVMVM
jgi:hypothetical protein